MALVSSAPGIAGREGGAINRKRSSMSQSLAVPELLQTQARAGDMPALGRLLEMYRNYLRVIARTMIGQALRVRLDASDYFRRPNLAETWSGSWARPAALEQCLSADPTRHRTGPNGGEVFATHVSRLIRHGAVRRALPRAHRSNWSSNGVPGSAT